MPETKINKTKDILTASEAAKFIRMRFETFKKLAESGEIPGRRINNRGDWRFYRGDLLAWIRSGNTDNNTDNVSTHIQM